MNKNVCRAVWWGGWQCTSDVSGTCKLVICYMCPPACPSPSTKGRLLCSSLPIYCYCLTASCCISKYVVDALYCDVNRWSPWLAGTPTTLNRSLCAAGRPRSPWRTSQPRPSRSRSTAAEVMLPPPSMHRSFSFTSRWCLVYWKYECVVVFLMHCRSPCAPSFSCYCHDCDCMKYFASLGGNCK